MPLRADNYHEDDRDYRYREIITQEIILQDAALGN
jgi:hypothetical protein